MLCCCIRMLDVSSLLLLWVVFDTCARSAPAVQSLALIALLLPVEWRCFALASPRSWPLWANPSKQTHVIVFARVLTVASQLHVTVFESAADCPSYHMSFGWSVAVLGPSEATAFDVELSLVMQGLVHADGLSVLQGATPLMCHVHQEAAAGVLGGQALPALDPHASLHLG